MKNSPTYEEMSTELSSMKELIINLCSKVEELEKDLKEVEHDNLSLIENNIGLSSKLDEALTRCKKLESKQKEADKRIKDLEKENQKLVDKLHRKNSRNSSIPPSKDENRPKKNNSLREKSGKKVGGQKGHKGDTLKMSSNPTSIVNHIADICENCGHLLFENPVFVKKRQVVDIPNLEPIITEHRIFSRECACCGHRTTAKFPKGVNAPISYGPKTEAIISYMSVRHYIPIDRIKEFLNQVFGMEISKGTINNKLAKSADKLLKYYTWIQNQIATAQVVGCDETGCRVNGDKNWIWTWQTDQFTYLAHATSRGEKTIHERFPNGLPNAIMVHDCYSAQFNIACKGHQMCTAHLLRELNYFIEKGKTWAIKFKKQIKNSLELLKKIKLNPTKNFSDAIRKINQEIDTLLIGKKKKGKFEAFKNRMRKHRKSLLRFLDDPSIPPDNNGSERALRNVKVKMKVSGMFKTDLGADQFAVIRSVVDTFIKRRQPVLNSLIKMVS